MGDSGEGPTSEITCPKDGMHVTGDFTWSHDGIHPSHCEWIDMSENEMVGLTDDFDDCHEQDRDEARGTDGHYHVEDDLIKTD